MLVIIYTLLYIPAQALVRKAEPDVVDMLPRSVELVIGDVGDPSSLKNAVQGCNKIIYCATARSSITGDLIRVDHQGVYNLTKALQVFVFFHYLVWSIGGKVTLITFPGCLRCSDPISMVEREGVKQQKA